MRFINVLASVCRISAVGCLVLAAAHLASCSPATETVSETVPDTSAYTRVTLPSGADLLVFKAPVQDSVSKAVIILPGGGYCFLAQEHEGKDVAAWMNSKGITAFVLLYQFPNGDSSIPNRDAAEAFDYARSHSSELGGYAKVGIMGSSAGGHLASTVATHTPAADFQILLYPVITMDTLTTHRGSHDFLLGAHPTPEAELLFSNERQVSAQTPPAFIALSLDDDIVPALPNGVAYAQALAQKGVSTTLLCYPRGGHGWGWRTSFEFSSQWKAELEKFLLEK